MGLIIDLKTTTISLWKSKTTKNLWTLEMIQSLDRVTTSDIAKLLGIFKDALPTMKDGQISLYHFQNVKKKP